MFSKVNTLRGSSEAQSQEETCLKFSQAKENLELSHSINIYIYIYI